jgi:hypothetical protein
MNWLTHTVEYATSNGFWVFVGSFLLVTAPFYGVAAIVRAWRWPPDMDEN